MRKLCVLALLFAAACTRPENDPACDDVDGCSAEFTQVACLTELGDEGVCHYGRCILRLPCVVRDDCPVGEVKCGASFLCVTTYPPVSATGCQIQ